MRAAAYLALLALCALAPLLVAAFERGGAWSGFVPAFGACLGWLAAGLWTLEFALVTRVRAAAAAFGSDALLAFHRAMAFAAIVYVIVHVALLAPGWPSPFAAHALQRSGALALWAALLLVALSILRRRLRCSYELWRATHRLLALVVVAATAWHIALALPAEHRLSLLAAAACAALAFGLVLAQRVVRPLALRRRPWELVENRDEGASTRTLVLRALGHEGLRFKPGQFVWLATARGLWAAQEHPISIASSPELEGGRTIELSIKALGDWSEQVVPRLAPGARLRVDGPFGAFTPDDAPAQRLVLVAGGVGVTPMRSILLAMRDRGDRRPVTLFFAAANRSRAMFIDELERLESELDFHLVRVFETPTAGDDCERGWLSVEILRRHLPADLRFAHMFICGPIPMMELAERIAGQLGLRSSQVHTERFDMV